MDKFELLPILNKEGDSDVLVMTLNNQYHSRCIFTEFIFELRDCARNKQNSPILLWGAKELGMGNSSEEIL